MDINLNNVDRSILVRVLEAHGYACYESESTDALREAVRQDIAAGEIEEFELSNEP
jgi:hypothetical protein